MLVLYYAKVEGYWPVVVELLRMLEGGDIDPEDVELPGAPILLEGVRGKDEQDQCKSLERGKLLKTVAVLFFVGVERSNLIGDLVAVLVGLVYIVGEGWVLREEVDHKFKGVRLKGVL